MNPTQKRGLKAWGYYVGGSAGLLGLAGALVVPWVSASARPGVWAGLGLAVAVQAVAFAALLIAAGRRPRVAVAGWAVGTFLRLLCVGGLGVVLVTRNGPLAIDPLALESALVALAAGVLALLWLEPLAYRWRRAAR